MNPATISALVQLGTLVLSVFQQYSQGQITEDQAAQMLQQAANNLQSAIKAFETAAPPTS